MKPIDFEDNMRKIALAHAQVLETPTQDQNDTENLKLLILLLDLPVPSKIYLPAKLWSVLIPLIDQKQSFERIREAMRESLEEDLKNGSNE